MSLTSTPHADLSNGRITVRVGAAIAVVNRRSSEGPSIVNGPAPGYRITCEALTDPDETRPGLVEDVAPWAVEIPTDVDLRAALRIAEVVANRADEHLGRTRRFREDALAKIDEAIRAETTIDTEAEEADR